MLRREPKTWTADSYGQLVLMYSSYGPWPFWDWTTPWTVWDVWEDPEIPISAQMSPLLVYRICWGYTIRILLWRPFWSLKSAVCGVPQLEASRGWNAPAPGGSLQVAQTGIWAAWTERGTGSRMGWDWSVFYVFSLSLILLVLSREWGNDHKWSIINTNNQY